MSESMKVDCKDPAGHWKHLCELRKQGKEQEVKDLNTTLEQIINGALR